MVLTGKLYVALIIRDVFYSIDTNYMSYHTLLCYIILYACIDVDSNNKERQTEDASS